MNDADAQLQEHEIKIHLPGLIKILGETLYSEPEVAIREMIQNAHDSCLRRMAEEEGFAAARINIECNTFERTLTFRDNGSGMTEQEIHEFLSTIGKGYTAELRQALSEKNRQIAERLIGRFGLGLLSAFIIAENIEIRTRSYMPGSRGYTWECDGNITYTVAEMEREDVGSEVIIRVSPNHVQTILSEEVLTSVIKTYADFLSIPIYLNRSAMPVNVMEAPWHRRATSAEYTEYVRARYEDIAPLEVVPIEHEEADLSVYGVLYIPRHTMIEIKTYGDVDVYISRMSICSGDRELLPVWAKFVRGIVDSPSLTPTLSRETVRKDEKYHRVREVLSQTILNHLDNLAANDPRQLREVVTSHNTLIKAWALEDDQFFDKICDLVLFDTGEYGKMSVPTYLERFGEKGPEGAAEATDGDKGAEEIATDKRIYYFSEAGSGTQQKILFKEAGLCVIDGSYGAEEAFLRKYDERHDDIEVKKLDAGAGYIFEPVEDQDGRWARLEEEFMLRKIPARVVRFRPTDIPAVLLRAEEGDGEHEETVRKLVEDPDVNPQLRRFLKQLLQERESYRRGALSTGMVLHLNPANPIIQQLAVSERNDPVRDLAMTVLYNNAVLFESHSVTPENAQVMFQGNNRAIEQLISAHQKAQGLEAQLTRNRLEHADALAEQQQYADQQEEKARAAAGEAEDIRSEANELKQRLADNGRQLRELDQQRQEKEQQCKELLDEIEHRRADFRSSEGKRQQLSAQIDKLEDELAQEAARLQELETALDSIPTAIRERAQTLGKRDDAVFIVRPFRSETRWVYDECIKPACEQYGLSPIYLEDKPKTGPVWDRIIRYVWECGILIADLGGNNPNVMYEVGAAHVLGKTEQTILLTDSAKDLAFDVSGFHVFEYGSATAAAALRGRIERALENITRSSET